MDILTTIGKTIATLGIVIASWFGYSEPTPLPASTPVGADTNLYVGGTVYYLAGSGVTSSATSLTLTSLTLPQNDYPLQDADFASTFYLTLEPGSTSRQEFASCTTVGANTGGNVTISGCTRGLSPITPYTASSTLQFSHSGGSKVIFSNSPAFYDQFTAKGNDESITGIYTFSASPIVPTPTTATQAANKTYVDSVTNAGAATSTESLGGIIELGTLSEQETSYNGGSDKPTVLQTKNSTSTCQVIGSYNIVASSTTGKLDKGCFDQTALYNFTATTTFSNATTTFNGIYYGMPNTQGLASSTIQNNGGGVLTWTLPDWRLLASSTLSSTVSTTTLANIPLATDLTIRVAPKIVTSGAGRIFLQFNSDTSGNYGYTSNTNDTSATAYTFGQNVTGIQLTGTNCTIANGLGGLFTIKIINMTSYKKMIEWTGSCDSQSSANAPYHVSGSALWNNTTAQISSVNLGSDGTIGAGTVISIYGSNK